MQEGIKRPMAAAYRPETLDDVVGQKHLLSKDSVFRKRLENGTIQNMIFYGPSGSGKTTVASIIARMTNRKLYRLNGTQASTGDIKDIIAGVDMLGAENGVLLYLDEIQYLNKKQQQSLLEVLEDGSVTLIASTTENPYHAIFNAVLSRCTIFQFEPLSPDDIREGIEKALARYNRENSSNISLEPEALSRLSYGSGGDMRKALNALELVCAAMISDPDGTITEEMAKQVTQRSSNRFDNFGDEHYNLLSALQKSIRGSDENAALHYLERLLDADGMLPAIRRILVMACEDIGLAYPNAIAIVKRCTDIALQVGMPEAQIPLSDAVILLATAPKSNSGESAIMKAMADVKKGGFGDIPTYLKDSTDPFNRALDREEKYKYPHSFPDHWVEQQYLPDNLRDARYYERGDNKTEQAAKSYWDRIKGRKG
ncbi:MAG: replication-associated recombination protein A [Oscillospiraceae bacterium]|nr:replication-associated recombination protein A [Oscillospiraceae bacterium]